MYGESLKSCHANRHRAEQRLYCQPELTKLDFEEGDSDHHG